MKQCQRCYSANRRAVSPLQVLKIIKNRTKQQDNIIVLELYYIAHNMVIVVPYLLLWSSIYCIGHFSVLFSCMHICSCTSPVLVGAISRG